MLGFVKWLFSCECGAFTHHKHKVRTHKDNVAASESLQIAQEQNVFHEYKEQSHIAFLENLCPASTGKGKEDTSNSYPC